MVHADQAKDDDRQRVSNSTKALLVAIALLLTALVAVVAGFAYLRHSLDASIRHIEVQVSPKRVTSSDSHQSTPTKEPLNFLILGSDSRVSAGDPSTWQAGDQRSDVMMLMQLNSDRTHMSAMSIPRDLWVEIPGHGEAKINSAYSLGGPSLAISTVQELFHIPIHHFMIVDFQGFAALTDQLGGVSIQTTDGVVNLNGTQALDFVRERYSLPAGDFDRVRRQQAWIKSILSAALDNNVISNPVKLQEMLQTVLSHSAVDPGLTFDSMLSLAYESRNLRPSEIDFFTVPVSGTSTSADGQSIVLRDDAAIQKLSQALMSGNLHKFVHSSNAVRTLDSGPVY